MSKWIGLGWFALALSTFATACGGDEAAGSGGTGGSSGSTGNTGGASAGTGGGTPSGPCAQACTKVVGQACGDATSQGCLARCAVADECPTEVDAYYSCVATTATLACASGVTTVTGCDSQEHTYAECFSCKPETDDTACGTCAKGSCCSELASYNLAGDVVGFDMCIRPCTNKACIDACTVTYPAAGAVLDSIIACEDKSCAKPCLCAAAMTDQACTACAKANCCELLVPYWTAADIDGYSTCITPCTTQACEDACAMKFPSAGAAFKNLNAMCLTTTCSASCL